MPFRAIYYHVVWSTRNRAPLITPAIEKVIVAAIAKKSVDLHSEIFAMNTVSDHVHVAVSIALSVAVSKWVQQVKGISTREVNLMFPDLPERFSWQRSYGVLTFGEKNLPMVVEYINRQKEHHAIEATISTLNVQRRVERLQCAWPFGSRTIYRLDT